MEAKVMLGVFILFLCGYDGVSASSGCNCLDGRCTGGICDGCKPGYRGVNCDISCPPSCLMCQQHNNTCTECENGRFGDFCEILCTNCSGNLCDSQGSCRLGCKPNHYGKKCHNVCRNTCRKIDNDDRLCHRLDGRCSHGCTDGWFGKGCEHKCMSGCTSCHRNNGTCLSVCADGRACGRNCSGCLGGVCTQATGACTNGCSSTLYGTYCNISCNIGCRRGYCNQSSGACRKGCSNKLYGAYCNHTCNIRCRDGICGQITGVCTKGCSGTIHGAYCNHTCSTGCIGGICNQTTGACTEGCSNGFYGPNCNTCSRSCYKRECRIGPSENVTCTNGCVDGWWGSNCQYPCENNCLSCSNDSGVCEQCSGTLYGNTCGQTCSHRCRGQDCDTTGVCKQGCVRGWIGEKCQISALSFIIPGLAIILLTSFLMFWMGRRKCKDRKEKVKTVIKKDTGSMEEFNLREIQQSVKQAETFANCDIMTRVSVDRFRGYVEEQRYTGGLHNQFQRLPINPVYPCYEGDSSHLAAKNINGSILPYDHNRIILLGLSNTMPSDYINASLVKGYAEGSFIATQEPFAEVMGEFWTMVWQEDVSMIVMMANTTEGNRKKSEQYLPNKGEADMITQDITVKCLDERFEDDLIIRNLALSKEGYKSRALKQFCFTAWSDQNVPGNVTSLLNLYTAVTTSSSSSVGPVVVHCSTGAGLTGTYIALDYLINQAKGEGVVDVFDCVLQLRHQRMDLVQTEEQYLLIHDVLLQAIETFNSLSGRYTVPAVNPDMDTIEMAV